MTTTYFVHPAKNGEWKDTRPIAKLPPFSTPRKDDTVSKKFIPPFMICPPLDADHFAKCGDVGPAITDKEKRQVTESWTVEDADGMVISTHKTEEAAKRGLEAANKTLTAKGE